MSEVTIHVRVSPAVMRWGLAGALLSFMAVELASENVTLTTYYPAPSGIYAKMITTKDGYFGRDGGMVTVGLPPAGTYPANWAGIPTNKLMIRGVGGAPADVVGSYASTNEGITIEEPDAGSGQGASIDLREGGVLRGRFRADNFYDTLNIWASETSVILDTGGRIYPSAGNSLLGGAVGSGFGYFNRGSMRVYSADCGPTPKAYILGVTACDSSTEYATTMKGYWAENIILGTIPPVPTGTFSFDKAEAAKGEMWCCKCGGTCP